MNRPSVIVYGPQGSGKTRNAEELRRHFGLEKILDGDFNAEDFPLINYLILTNLRPSLEFTKRFRKILVLRVEDVALRAGIDWQDPRVPPA